MSHLVMVHVVVSVESGDPSVAPSEELEPSDAPSEEPYQPSVAPSEEPCRPVPVRSLVLIAVDGHYRHELEGHVRCPSSPSAAA